MSGVASLSEDDQKFIIDRAVRGYDAAEISHMLSYNQGKPIREETVEEFLDAEDTQEKVELEKQVREKRTEITKQDLLDDLTEMKEELREWIEDLKSEGHGKTTNEAFKNVLKITNQIGELIGELDKKTQKADNIININKSEEYIQQNFTTVVQHLPKEEKEDVVKQLQDDPEVENFVIERKPEAQR
ncbi:MAG: hypothetical protein SVV03_02470 [Candidatus Nanohaloarchaea archaeon]|nr:hypothetical protein [Candidatus Nanohaloarchaea archaeon]